MGFNDSQIELCMSFAIFHRDESHNYSFELNSFQMYYVVDCLMNKSYEKILNLISYNKHNVPRIRPEWYDVFELLLSSMKIGDERRKYLLEWTFENDIEALLNVDPNSLEDEFKDKIFKTILLNYKEKKITSSPNMGIDFSRKLASFCTTDESLKFFITEYKNEKELGPYLYLLSFVYWFINSDGLMTPPANRMKTKSNEIVYGGCIDDDGKMYGCRQASNSSCITCNFSLAEDPTSGELFFICGCHVGSGYCVKVRAA